MNYNYEIMCEFSGISAMKNIVKSWLNSWNECTYENMVEFINLKLFLIQPQICFSEGKCFTHPK